MRRSSKEDTAAVTPPQRLLLVSADIGAGHNATARAVEQAARGLWPQCEVRWVDSLDAMGRGVGPAFRWIYRVNVESTPWLYDLFYEALWRYRWFADGSRRFVGRWAGRGLRPMVAEYEPDLVVSTYPMGTAGLSWLRRAGELDVPLAAVISDFSPHPFWVYSEADMHYVMSEESLRELHRAQPDAAGTVCVPPVISDFQVTDKREARRRFGLAAEGFVVLISCGSFGFGSIDRAVNAARRVNAVSQVVVVCGRNEDIRRRVREIASEDPRVMALGWVEDMATLTAAADVVVTNAGGATALEALACGRAVVMFEPIAGHGKANAALMAQAELAQLCPASEDLCRVLEEFANEPGRLSECEQRARHHALSRDFADQVKEMASLSRRAGLRKLRAQDAFFIHASTPEVPQQTGAVLRLGAASSGLNAEAWREHLAGLVEQRARHLPVLRQRLVLRGDRRAAWTEVASLDPRDHVASEEIGDQDERRWHMALHDFFTAALPAEFPPWQMKILRASNGDADLLIKMHHALCDGVAMTNTLINLLCDEASLDVSAPVRRNTDDQPRWMQRTWATARGLVRLAMSGSAPVSGLEGNSTADRSFVWAKLPAQEVRDCARAYQVRTSVVLLALVAEAMHRFLDTSAASPARNVRVMATKTTRTGSGGVGVHAGGNYTSAAALDLPVGPMAFSQRVTAISDRLAQSDQSGAEVAASAVLTALGNLPEPIFGWAVRRIYQQRFFTLVLSVLPGVRRPPRIAGARIREVVPVLPLADGVGLGIGAISWGESITFGITADQGLVAEPAKLVSHIQNAFDDLRPSAGSAQR